MLVVVVAAVLGSVPEGAGDCDPNAGEDEAAEAAPEAAPPFFAGPVVVVVTLGAAAAGVVVAGLLAPAAAADAKESPPEIPVVDFLLSDSMVLSGGRVVERWVGLDGFLELKKSREIKREPCFLFRAYLTPVCLSHTAIRSGTNDVAELVVTRVNFTMHLFGFPPCAQTG